MSDTKKPEAVAAAAKKERNRSPSFPVMPLKEAIEKLATLYEKEGVSWTPVNVAAHHWGYSAKSSSGIRTVAALLHFGLVDEDGMGGSRRIRLSERGKTIVLAPHEGHSEERALAIRQAATSPRLYAELWNKHGPKLPSDQTLEYELIKDGNFNRESVRGFIKDFKSTVAFASLGETDRLGASDNGQKGDGSVSDKKDTLPPHDPRKMPEVERTPATPYDLTLPLVSGGQAILRIPRTMTEEDYTLLTTLLDANLKAMKRALVTKPEEAASPA